VAGQAGGRRLAVPPSGTRPTSDRAREALFSSLDATLHGLTGVRFLDLYAGSGAVGLEAWSRGAARVHFVESDANAVSDLRARLIEWGAQGATVERIDTLRYLRGKPEAFDIVFLDPPYAAGLLGSAAQLLEDREWLAPGALIYVENAARIPLPELPETWRLAKTKRAGEVGYHLFVKGAPGGDT